jgi:GNAT superfamily N-acetyltransferase
VAHLTPNPTQPLPESFSDAEPALLTVKEFLDLRNPEGKLHPGDAYETTLATLNHSQLQPVGSVFPWTGARRERKLTVLAYPQALDALVYLDPESDKVVAVLHDGTLYRDRFYPIPNWYVSNRSLNGLSETVRVHIASEREVKYPEEYVVQVEDIAARNRESFPYTIRRVLIDGTRFEVRSEQRPRQDKLDTIAFLDPSGLIVAEGSNEWGATLLRVAEEYQGRGLGRALAAFWYEFNPKSKSGGFTPSGRANAVATWQARVHEFLSLGWYSALVREGRMTQARVREITADLPKQPPKRRAETERVEPEADLRVYVDDDGIAFVLYDARFLSDRDEKYVHGYGFLRSTTKLGSFFYRIEHDPKYRKLATAIGLQLAKDQGEPLYVATEPGDLIEWEIVPQAERDGDYVSLMEDVLPLKALAAEERRLRRKSDPYREIPNSLLEIAESKWS